MESLSITEHGEAYLTDDSETPTIASLTAQLHQLNVQLEEKAYWVWKARKFLNTSSIGFDDRLAVIEYQEELIESRDAAESKAYRLQHLIQNLRFGAAVSSATLEEEGLISPQLQDFTDRRCERWTPTFFLLPEDLPDKDGYDRSFAREVEGEYERVLGRRGLGYWEKGWVETDRYHSVSALPRRDFEYWRRRFVRSRG